MSAKKYTSMLYLFLALAVFASSVAWAPAPLFQQQDPNDPNPGVAENCSGWKCNHTYPTRGRVSARLIGDRLLLNAEKLPRRHSFFVKVRRSARGGWVRLGVSYTDNGGFLEDDYNLPKTARKLPAVQVCLKDVYTNKAYCTTAHR